MPTVDHRPQSPYRQMELSAHAAEGEMLSPERVREQVEKLRMQAELFEQQRQQSESQSRELEQSTLRKARFNADLNELGMKIHNAVRRIERELESMSKEQQELEHVCECFNHHLQILSTLQPQMWPPEGVSERMREALPKLDLAENDFSEAYALGHKYHHTDIMRTKPGESAPERLTWARLKEEMTKGFFYHLPLFLLILISWVIYVLITTP
ncbi:MAG: hypothetical protein Q4F35_05545 [Akkermansia sp.]|nr:hypothetical protein [Akkermansia sp.]